MATPSAGDLLQAIAGFITAAAAASLVFAKAAQVIRRGKLETFNESLKAMQNELDRCHADHNRERQEHRQECADWEVERDHLEERLRIRAKQYHDLTDRFQAVLLELDLRDHPDQIEGQTDNPNENGHP